MPPLICFAFRITKIAFCCCMLFTKQAISQAGSLSPANPVAGDTLRIGYNMQDTSAGLKGEETIYTKITTYAQDGSYQWYTLQLSGAQGSARSFVVPASAASISIRFYTLNKDDDRAALKTYIYDKDRRTPVSGAYFDSFFTGDPGPYFEKEIKGHPLNYLAYGKYFNVVSMVKVPDESKKIIDSLLQPLEKLYYDKKNASAGLLAALCVGYAKTGKLTAAKSMLFHLFELFPQTQETSLAFTLYNYEYYKATSKQIEEDVRQKLMVIFKKWPDAALTGDTNVTYYLSKEKDMTVADFERALKPRYREGSIPYYGFDLLPGIYIDRNQNLDSARAMLMKIIGIFQDGTINHQYRLSSNHYRLYMPLLLQKLSSLDLLQKQYNDAIIHSTTGIELVGGSNNEGNFLPDLLQLRATAFTKTGNMVMALEDYKLLYKTGKNDALDSIKKIIAYCSSDKNGYDAFVAALQNKVTIPNTGKFVAAPAFTGKDLQGRTIQLSALKGKIVLINFWGTGCGPCIGEMPELNRLVQKYQHNDSVAFLAITGDETIRLKQFFKKRTFLYTIVNEAGNVSNAYEVESLPVHIVIGKNGEVLNRSIGAREDIFDYLDKIIAHNL